MVIPPPIPAEFCSSLSGFQRYGWKHVLIIFSDMDFILIPFLLYISSLLGFPWLAEVLAPLCFVFSPRVGIPGIGFQLCWFVMRHGFHPLTEDGVLASSLIFCSGFGLVALFISNQRGSRELFGS